MKLSVSLPDEDVALLDRYVKESALKSRSAGIRRAIRMLGNPELQDAYAEAFGDWEQSEDAAAWEAVDTDGLSHEAW